MVRRARHPRRTLVRLKRSVAASELDGARLDEPCEKGSDVRDEPTSVSQAQERHGARARSKGTRFLAVSQFDAARFGARAWLACLRDDRRDYAICVRVLSSGMRRARTIVIEQVLATPRAESSSERSAVAWIVRIDGEEFTHGHIHALTFASPEDAAQFVLDLRDEYDADTRLTIVGLDALGLPLEERDTAEARDAPPEPRVSSPRERLTVHVAKTLFLDAPATFKKQVLLDLYAAWLPRRRHAVLGRLEAEVLVASLKTTLPFEVVEWAACALVRRSARSPSGWDNGAPLEDL